MEPTTYEYMERASERLAVVVPITTLATIVLLLFLNFRSTAEVLIILGTLPTALIGGGMLSATVLTLALIPAIFLIWQRRMLRKDFAFATAEPSPGE